MRSVYLVLFVSSVVLGAPKAPQDDPSYCVYWIHKLSQIAELERSRVEVVPEIEKKEGYYSATDYDIELRARIIAIMKRIEKESK